MGVSFELLLPGANEDAEALERVLKGESPLAYVQRVTQLKLDAALRRLKERGLAPAPVVCSDTTVALGRRIFGKPVDGHDARCMLGALAGRTHRVLTAVAVGRGQKRVAVVSVSHVRFCDVSVRQINTYVDTGEPMGKAGAYAVQGAAAKFISRIGGSYSGIMGLPVFETAQLLEHF